MEKRVQKSNDLVSTGCFETSSAKLLLCQVVVWQVPDMASFLGHCCHLTEV